MTDLALALLRVWLGVVMLAHGVNHARSLERTTRWFAKVGFQPARVHAILSSLGEVAIGVGLVSGLLTSFAAAGLVATVAVAFWAIHRFAGFFVFARPDEGWEYVATLAVAATTVAVLGPGRLSLDHLLGIAPALDGVIGLAAVGGGLVAAGLVAATTWRRQEE